MNNITSAFFIVFASLALAMPAYTQDFKLEQDQLIDITNNLEQLNEAQLKQRKAYLLQQLENAEEASGGSGSSGSDSKALEKLNLMWVELNIIQKILAVGATGVVLDNLFGDEDKDSTPPVISLNGSNPTVVELGSVYVEAGATADTGELVSVSGSVNTNAVGTYTLTYTAMDDWGNVGTTTRTVNVVDTTAPVMSVTGANPATVELGASYTDAGATGSDLGGAVTVSSSGTVNTDAVGTYTITYTGTDPSGNSATIVRTINVVDTTAPVITVIGTDPIHELGDTYTDAGATATDLSGTVTVVTTGTVDTDTIGTYTLTYTSTDPSGNTATATRTVNVVDTTAPVITLAGTDPTTHELGDTYTDAGATATDFTGSITVTTNGTVNADAVGEYTLTYIATDPSGNTATATRTVNVVDTTAPVVTVTGSNPETVELGDTYTDAGATATDLSGVVTVVTTGSVDTDTVGSYTLTYTSTDPSGNAGTATRTVNVVDTTAPVVTVTGSNPATHELGDTYTDAGATATDLSGTVTVVTTGTVDEDTVGSYTLTYTSTDPSGNAGTATRTVNVVDTTAPAVTVTGTNPLTLEVGQAATYTDAGATATDASGTVTVVTTGSVNPQVVGEYTKTYTSTDASGNAGTATRTINVVDTTAPTVTLVGGTPFTVEVAQSGSFTEPGYNAVDNAATALTKSYIGSIPLDEVGEYSRIYTVTDASGNSTSVTRVVKVVDTTAPTVTLLGDNPKTVEADQNGTYVDPDVTAEDNDKRALNFSVASNVNMAIAGSYLYRWRVEDQSGNYVIVDRTVNVVDTTAPLMNLLGDNPNTVEAADGSEYVDPGTTATDNAASAMTKATSGTVDMGLPGSYTLDISYTDVSGNVSNKIRTVTVVDTSAPVISGETAVDTEVSQTGSYSMEPGVSASDNSSTALTKTESNTVDITTLGAYKDTTTFTDASGNSATFERNVLVVDTTAPTVTVLGEAVVLVIQYGSYTESGATASDNSAGPLEKSILGTVDVTTVGDYTLTYTFEDVSGNVGSGTRLVEVRPAGTTETGTSTYSTGTGTSTSSATSTGT